MSDKELHKKFRSIVTAIGYRPGIAVSLEDFLLAAPGQNAPEKPAIDYALSKLWIEPAKDSNAT